MKRRNFLKSLGLSLGALPLLGLKTDKKELAIVEEIIPEPIAEEVAAIPPIEGDNPNQYYYFDTEKDQLYEINIPKGTASPVEIKDTYKENTLTITASNENGTAAKEYDFQVKSINPLGDRNLYPEPQVEDDWTPVICEYTSDMKNWYPTPTQCEEHPLFVRFKRGDKHSEIVMITGGSGSDSDPVRYPKPDSLAGVTGKSGPIGTPGKPQNLKIKKV